MKRILAIMFVLFALFVLCPIVWAAGDSSIPPGMKLLLPDIKATATDMGYPIQFQPMLAAQIEKETCIHATHSKCGNPRAELKTNREYGFGFGQFTRANRADGSIRFDVWDELRKKHPDLAGWTWEKRFDARLQMRAFIHKVRQSEAGLVARNEFQKVSMGKADYNGGRGDLLLAKKRCRLAPKCDDQTWFNGQSHRGPTVNGVEAHIVKSKTKLPGYGHSFFDINQTYVRIIMLPDGKSTKYIPYWSAE